MCGVFGVYYFHGGAPAGDVPAFRQALQVMAHRGPDDYGELISDRLLLGHLRLSIIDLSPLGHQPMFSADGRTVIAYNGEVYNYKELRAQLKAAGHTFRSETDTEVILTAFREWGLHCSERFIGMWAFALYDEQEKRLILSRDRFGIKPLYYYRDDECLVFASEIKAIVCFLQCRGRTVKVNDRAVVTYIETGLVDGLEETFFEGIKRFPSAMNAVVQNGDIAFQPYWSLPEAAARLAQQKPGQAHVALCDLLSDATRLHLRSDVPVGICLSGGLDSSSLATFATRQRDRIHAFAVYFDEGEAYDERRYAEAVASQFGMRCHVQRVGHRDFLEKLSRMLWYLDEPTLAMGVFPQWHVMELASSEVKVVLTGQGGDEVFAGYTMYFDQYLEILMRGGHLPRLCAEFFGLAAIHGWTSAAKCLQRGLQGVLRPALPNDHRSSSGILSADVAFPMAMPPYNGSSKRVPLSDGLNDLLYTELTYTRLPALLRYEDRLSMAFSIESRVPFLDHRIVEFAFALPGHMKIHHGWSKYVLRQALDGLLPREITWRKDKKGFSTPLAQWLRGPLRGDVEAVIESSEFRKRGFWNVPNVRQLFQEHLAGRDRSWLLWRVLSTELWFRGQVGCGEWVSRWAFAGP